MIKKSSIYIIGIGAFLLSGCNNDMVQPEKEGEHIPIVFKASDTTVTIEEQAQTRNAGTAFPNNGSIAIVAANAPAQTIDWSSLYMNHDIATAGEEDASGKHSIVTSVSRYWPFDPNEYLSFMAYSPHTSQSSLLSIAATDNTKLEITSNPDITTSTPYPDLLYAAPTEAYNKTHGNVELSFSHVMAQVEIRVVAIDDDGKEITPNPVVTASLTLDTKVKSGTFDLLEDKWILETPSNNFSDFCTLAKDKSIPYTVSCLLLPSAADMGNTSINMADNTRINITLKDAAESDIVPFHATISEFTTNSVTASLVEGMKSVLTIKVRLKDITTGNKAFDLEGDLKPWNYQGESEVIIE